MNVQRSMKMIPHQILGTLLIILATGCASTKVYENQRAETGKLPRPNQIWVYDFAATPTDVPADSNLAQGHSPKSPADYALNGSLHMMQWDFGLRLGFW